MVSLIMKEKGGAQSLGCKPHYGSVLKNFHYIGRNAAFWFSISVWEVSQVSLLAWAPSAGSLTVQDNSTNF